MMNKKLNNEEVKIEIKKILDAKINLKDDFKNKLIKDSLLSIQINRYIEFKKSDEYGEEYKEQILLKLKKELKDIRKIDENNIFEVINLFQKENPSKGSLAHWTGLDNLKKYAEIDKKGACEKWNQLLDKNVNIVDRINNFIDIKDDQEKEYMSKFDSKFSVGLDTIAYILAGFNPEEYPVYKFGIYKEFTDLYELERIKSDYGKIYDDYLKIAKIIADIFNKLGYINDTTVRDGQDFIYCVVSYDSLRIESLVEYLYSISLELNKFEDDNKLFIDYINSLNKDYLKELAERYEGSDNVNGIREDIAKYLHDGNKLTVEKHEGIKKKEEKKHEKNILRGYSDLGILLPFYYEDIKNRVSNIQDNIIKNIKEINPLSKNYKFHKVGFQGSANYGGTRCWLVIYPEEKQSHQYARQLYLGISREKDEKKPYIRYGFYPGSNLEESLESDLDVVEINEFNYRNMVGKFKDDYEKYFTGSLSKIDKAYFVGAAIGGVDLTNEFIEKGIWKNGYDNKFIELVKDIKVGDRMAIKSTYTRKNKLPFEANDKYVSTMGIKAIGIVVENLGDGQNLRVNWKKVDPLREWFFFTMREVIWKVERREDDWMYGDLIDFTFENKEQDIDKFLEHPYWYEKYGKKDDNEESNKNVDFNLPLNFDSLYFEDEDTLKKQISVALKSGKSIILIGPPGTGKSKLAKCITESYKVNSKMVTAMSDWSSYDTIGGYKPSDKGDLYFENGIFLSSLKDKKDKDINCWLIIDEINRADIDKAFGPFFSALSGDDIELGLKDEESNNIELLLEKNLEEDYEENSSQYIIPEDWRIIGTMNTFDKTSLYEMSYAFMRRFAFIPVAIPKTIDYELVRNLSSLWKIKLNHNDYENISMLWKTINRYRKIGPALIEDMVKFIKLDGDYESNVIIYILPQLEGLFDDKLKKFYSDLIKLDFIKDKERLKNSIEDFFNISLGED